MKNETTEPRVKLSVTISAEAKEELKHMSEQSHLPYGEVLDCILTNCRPLTPNAATKLAADEIAIILSKLSRQDRNLAYLNLLVAMIAVINPDEFFMQELLKASQEKRQELAAEFAKAFTEKQQRLKSPNGKLH